VTAAELIEELNKMPPEAQVWHLWDAAYRTEIKPCMAGTNGACGNGDDGESL